VIDLGLLIILIIATEALTEVVVASEFPLFLELRTRLAQLAIPDTPRRDVKQYLIVAVYKLFSCGYCFSMWSAGFFGFFAPKLLENGFINWMCLTFVLHRLSNWLHVLYELVRKGRVHSHDVVLKLDKDEIMQADDLVDVLKEDH